MWRTMRMAALAAAVTLVLSGFALAQYRDGYYYGGAYSSQARQYGYQNGYRDGVTRGREEGRERDAYDGRNVDWRFATRGYQSWMGPINQYRDGYVDGYHNGFQDAYRRASRGGWGWGDGDRDRRRDGAPDAQIRPRRSCCLTGFRLYLYNPAHLRAGGHNAVWTCGRGLNGDAKYAATPSAASATPVPNWSQKGGMMCLRRAFSATTAACW